MVVEKKGGRKRGECRTEEREREEVRERGRERELMMYQCCCSMLHLPGCYTTDEQTDQRDTLYRDTDTTQHRFLLVLPHACVSS